MDLDGLGHVNNATYLSYFEMARAGYHAALTGHPFGTGPDADRLLSLHQIHSTDVVVARAEGWVERPRADAAVERHARDDGLVVAPGAAEHAEELEALANDGEILIAFGSNGSGTGARSRVMTRKSEDASLTEWLATIPGLKVDITVRRGDSFAHDHPIARIRIKDRAAISIRTLEPLGALPANGGPRPILFREDLSEPAPQPTLGDKMNGWALRAWKAMW